MTPSAMRIPVWLILVQLFVLGSGDMAWLLDSLDSHIRAKRNVQTDRLAFLENSTYGDDWEKVTCFECRGDRCGDRNKNCSGKLCKKTYSTNLKTNEKNVMYRCENMAEVGQGCHKSRLWGYEVHSCTCRTGNFCTDQFDEAQGPIKAESPNYERCYPRCHDQAICYIPFGSLSYICACDSGYTGDGINCEKLPPTPTPEEVRRKEEEKKRKEERQRVLRNKFRVFKAEMEKQGKDWRQILKEKGSITAAYEDTIEKPKEKLKQKESLPESKPMATTRRSATASGDKSAATKRTPSHQTEAPKKTEETAKDAVKAVTTRAPVTRTLTTKAKKQVEDVKEEAATQKKATERPQGNGLALGTTRKLEHHAKLPGTTARVVPLPTKHAKTTVSPHQNSNTGQAEPAKAEAGGDSHTANIEPKAELLKTTPQRLSVQTRPKTTAVPQQTQPDSETDAAKVGLKLPNWLKWGLEKAGDKYEYVSATLPSKTGAVLPKLDSAAPLAGKISCYEWEGTMGEREKRRQSVSHGCDFCKRVTKLAKIANPDEAWVKYTCKKGSDKDGCRPPTQRDDRIRCFCHDRDFCTDDFDGLSSLTNHPLV